MKKLLTLLALLLVGAPSQAMAETAAERSVLLVRQGAAALLRGRFERAIKAYDEALNYDKLSPIRKASILSDRGVAHWRLQQNETAISDFGAAIEINPQYPQVYNNKGNVLVDMNRHREAIEAYTQAIELAPTYGVAYNNRGGAYYELGKIEAAIRDFTFAIRYLSLNAVPHNGRGRSYLTRKQNYAALRDFNRAVKLNKTYGMVYLSRARAFVNVREYGSAVNDYTRAISMAKNVPQLYLERGRAYQASNQYWPAIGDYTKVIDLAPGHSEAYSRRGLSYALAKNSKKAFADIEKAIELDPSSAAAFLARAKVYKRIGNFEAARNDLNLVLDLSGEHAEALKLLAQMHEVKEEKEQAQSYYERSLAADPFQKGTREGLKRLTGEYPPLADKDQILETVSGWALSKDKQGRYFVFNESYPGVQVYLETYGEGEPRLIEWSPMTGEWKGVGLLRYAAGTRLETEALAPERKGELLQYAAVLDLKKVRLAAIEPMSWGDREAKWKWGNGSVSVTDPDGMVSEVQLREPLKRKKPGAATGTAYAPSPWGDIYQPSRRNSAARKRARVKKRRPRRKQNNSILDWLFQ